MALLNHATREVTAKLVYYGPAFGGKTTNLQWIHDHLSFDGKGKLVSLATEEDRTLFFDFLAPGVADIRDMRLRLQVYAVPGQVLRESTRRMVLERCDAVVFVADSQASVLEANAESLQGLQRHLLANEIDPTAPLVFQYNKRDLGTALPVSELNARLNPAGVPFFEAVALEGRGVEETLNGVSQALHRSLADQYGAAPVFSARPQPPPEMTTPVVAAPPTPAPPPPSSPSPATPAPRREGLREGQWLYLLDGVQRGPVDIEELVDLVLTSIPESTRVWHPGLEGWVPARRVPAIAEEIPPPLPIPGAPRATLFEEDMPDFDTVPPQFRIALIADEDEGFRKYLAMPLAAQGFTVLEAADGSVAWQLAVQNRPWLILADISMPEVDGFEFCARVRSHPVLGHTPLLFISDSDKYKERYRALKLGADDFLSKQMPIRELLMRIQLLLARYSDLQQRQGGTELDSSGAFQGRVEVFGAPALLQMCAQGKLTGRLTAHAEDQAHTAATVGFRDGEIISASVGPLTGVDAASTFLTWEKGSFRFSPGDPGPGQPLARSVEHLLLESSRLIDEARAGRGDPA